MGADIHSLAEYQYKRDETLVDDKWYAIKDALWAAPYYRPEFGVLYGNAPYQNQPFRDRNYRLFAALAGVRNYEGIDPIMKPRGVPDDASKRWKKYTKNWGPDLHSHSWLTVEELNTAILTLDPDTWDRYVIEPMKQAIAPLRTHSNYANFRIMFAFDN